MFCVSPHRGHGRDFDGEFARFAAASRFFRSLWYRREHSCEHVFVPECSVGVNSSPHEAQHLATGP
jgi:hypothetical protein